MLLALDLRRGARMSDIEGFLGAIGDVPAFTDELTVRRRSRDMSARFSPILQRAGQDKSADLVVAPRDEADVLTVAGAAARHRVPLMARGGGTANFGQNIPLKGGAIVDMTALNQVLWAKDGVVRAQAGIKIEAIDEATRPSGWELRIHPSTKKMATIGGFIGGGHAGIGSCAYGIMRDRGNIRALRVISVEDEPRIVELRGEEVNLVHHAYGANGLITEVELPLAPAWPWREAVVCFPDFMTSVAFSHALAVSDGIVKKLISLLGWPMPMLIRRLQPFAREGESMVLCMVADQSFPFLEGLAASFGGTITASALEGQGPYHGPIWEYAWGHTRMHINAERPEIVGAIGLYASTDLVEAIGRSHARFAELGPFHFEVKRFDGKLSFQGSPLFPFVDDDHMAAVMQGMADDGAMVANNHTFLVKQGGMKSITAADRGFKRKMDPYDLMNPGKMVFDEEPQDEGAALPSAGWTYTDQAAS